MAGVGAGMGRGISGYFNTRKAARDDRIEGDDEVRRREVTDPRDDQIAELTMRLKSMETALKTVKFPGEMQEAVDTESNRQAQQKHAPGIIKDTEQARQDTEENRKQQQKNQPGIIDDTERARQDAESNRQAVQKNMPQTIADNETLRQQGVKTATEKSEEATYRFDTRDSIRGAREGLKNYEVTGQVKSLEDGYNLGVNDEHDIEYFRSPVDANGKPSMTAWGMKSKQSGETIHIYDNQDELAKSYEDFWLDPAKVDEAYNMGGGGGGRAYSYGGLGRGTRGRSGGSGATGVKNQEIANLAASYLASEEGAGKTDADAYMWAWDKASMSKKKAPIDYVNGLYSDLIKLYTKPDTYGRINPDDIETGKQQARQIAEEFAERLGVEFDPNNVDDIGGDTDYFNSLNGGIKTPDDLVSEKVGR